MEIPAYSVGDIIRNTLTGEQGRVVEPHQKEEIAYVVSLMPESPTAPREALWFLFEVDGSVVSISGDGFAAEGGIRQICWICGHAVPPEVGRANVRGKPVHRACREAGSIPIGSESA